MINMNKIMKDFPWLVCLIWNVIVLGTGCFMIIHEHNAWYSLIGILIGWPESE